MKSGALVWVLLGLAPLAPSGAQAAAQEVGRGEGDRRRVSIEWYGGWAGIAASDLKGLTDYDAAVERHLFDAQLDTLRTSGQIRSWDEEREGARPRMEHAWSTGGSARVALTEEVAVSFGLRYVSAGGTENVRTRYTRLERNGDERIEDLTYLPYTLTAKGYAPLFGIHVGKSVTARFRVEAYLQGGPLFARLDYSSDWAYRFSIEGPSMNGVVFETDGRLEGRGKGTGVAADLGARIGFGLGSRMFFFVEGSYAYQVVKSLSGPGSETRGEARTSWEGEWAVRGETIAAPWGTVELRRPTNDWPEGPSAERLGAFRLDLSGVQLRVGLSFRL